MGEMLLGWWRCWCGKENLDRSLSLLTRRPLFVQQHSSLAVLISSVSPPSTSVSTLSSHSIRLASRASESRSKNSEGDKRKCCVGCLYVSCPTQEALLWSDIALGCNFSWLFPCPAANHHKIASEWGTSVKTQSVVSFYTAPNTRLAIWVGRKKKSTSKLPFSRSPAPV